MCDIVGLYEAGPSYHDIKLELRLFPLSAVRSKICPPKSGYLLGPGIISDNMKEVIRPKRLCRSIRVYYLPKYFAWRIVMLNSTCPLPESGLISVHPIAGIASLLNKEVLELIDFSMRQWHRGDDWRAVDMEYDQKKDAWIQVGDSRYI